MVGREGNSIGPTLMAIKGGIKAGLIGGGLTLGLNPVGNVFVMSGGGAVLIGDTGILGADLLLDRDLLDLSSLDLRFLSREEDLL